MNSRFNVIIIEGTDRIGKDTQIRKINETFCSDDFDFLHYTKPPKLESSKDYIDYQREVFDSMWSNIYYSQSSTSKLILNRSYIGEAVYSRYRGYNGNYVFEDESKWLNDGVDANKIILILMQPDAKENIKRDDGQSFYTSLETLKQEIHWFDEAFNMSNLIHKHKIYVGGRTIEDIASEIRTVLI